MLNERRSSLFNIGAHLSSSKGFLKMAQDAVDMGGNTFQFFTRNPRGFKAKDINLEDVKSYHEYIADKGFAKIVAHAPYTLNPCSADDRVKELAKMIVEDDLKRMEHVPGNYYNMHPGSHVKQGTDKGIALIADFLNDVLQEGQSTMLLLETMSGKGSEVGGSFLELFEIIKRVELKDKVGVCLDLCHVSDAGYDIKNNLDGVLGDFDKAIGINLLKAIHLNDSKNVAASHKDRHETIGNGYLGLEAVVRVINHPLLKELPFILETPLENEGHKAEITLLKSNYKD